MSSITLDSKNKNYAVTAARDGKITFSISKAHGETRSQWIRALFASLDDQLNITFQEISENSAELNFNVIPITKDEFLNLPGGAPSLIEANDGKIIWKSAKDTRQYGGVQDQLTASRAVLESLGLSYPDNSPWNLDHSKTIMSYTNTSNELNGNTLGTTFYFTQKDLSALEVIYGKTSAPNSGAKNYHISGSDETLLIGRNGVQDYFYIKTKGYDETDIRSYDEFGRPWYNNYKNPSIANFNPGEGDKILISRRLMSPFDGDPEKTEAWLQNEGKNLLVSYVYSSKPDDEWKIWASEFNIIYNDAGKLMLNVNGRDANLGPLLDQTNNYLAAFIDIVGPSKVAHLPQSTFSFYDEGGEGIPSHKDNIFALNKLNNSYMAEKITFDGDWSDYKFFNLGSERYGIQRKGDELVDEITGVSVLEFNNETISVANDISSTFNQVIGINDISAAVFRLYNAAFSRLPDSDGLRNWINANASQARTFGETAEEFVKSEEFKVTYGDNLSDEAFLTALYNNVLGRDPDQDGLNHYLGLLQSGKARGALLIDFSESPENRVNFTEVTGLS